METGTKQANTAQSNVISREMASKEVFGWLSDRQIRQRRIEDHEDTIQELIDAVVDGDIRFKDDNLILKLTHELDDGAVKELIFKPRIYVQQIRQRLRKISAGDMDGRVMAYVGSATDKSNQTLEKISSTDWSLIQTIAVFFM